jgi:glycosyltransferase involved in cell wall biosynthesis
MKETISIVIPAKDEEATIAMLLKDLDKVISSIKKYNFEIIVIDDKSKDRTGQIAKSSGAKVIRNTGKSGKGNALMVGFKEAKGDYIITMDADYSHRPEEIPLFLEKVEKGYGFVIGSRSTGGSEEYTKIRTLGNVVLTGLVALFFGVRLTDALNGYKIFKVPVAKEFSYKSREYEIEIELISNSLRKGYRIGEIPSHERIRAGGKMKSFAVIHGPKFLFRIIKEGISYRIWRLFRR